MDALWVASKVLRKHWDIFVRWALGIAGLVLGAVGIVDDHGWFRLLSLGFGAYFLVTGVWKFVREWRDLEQVLRSRQQWEYTTTYDSWLPLDFGRTRAIYSPAVNRRLASEEPIVLEQGEQWLPKGRARELHDRHKVRLGRNDPKLRLATDLLEGTERVSLDRTDYASFLATNRLAYRGWYQRSRDEMFLSFEDLEPSTQVEGRLPDLADSRCANHIGGDILAVGEGCVFVQLQNKRNGMYPNLWMASGSGSFDVQDWTSSNSLQDLVKTGMLRELTEEMKLKPAQVPSHAETKVIGYSRATYLGGKPQFYGVCRIGDVKPGTDRYARRYERLTFKGGAAGLVAALEAFVEENADGVAPPLEMHVLMTKHWLESDPDAEEWLLGVRQGS